MDTSIRDLERVAATGDRAAKLALLRAKNRAGLGAPLYTRDLAELALGEREHGSFAAHAAGVRAVIKANRLEKLGSVRAAVRTQSYSMCSSIDLDIDLAPGGSLVFDAAARDREITHLAAELSVVFGLRVYHQTSLYIWNRESESDSHTDYSHPQGPTIRPEDQETFLVAFLKAEERKAAREAARS